MLGGVQMEDVAKDIKVSRTKMNFDRNDLAIEAQVGLRFVTSVEERKALKWRPHLIQKLLRVLLTLDLKLHADEILKKIKRNVRKKKRSKFDRRPGGIVPMRRCRH